MRYIILLALVSGFFFSSVEQALAGDEMIAIFGNGVVFPNKENEEFISHFTINSQITPFVFWFFNLKWESDVTLFYDEKDNLIYKNKSKKITLNIAPKSAIVKIQNYYIGNDPGNQIHLISYRIAVWETTLLIIHNGKTLYKGNINDNAKVRKFFSWESGPNGEDILYLKSGDKNLIMKEVRLFLTSFKSIDYTISCSQKGKLTLQSDKYTIWSGNPTWGMKVISFFNGYNHRNNPNIKWWDYIKDTKVSFWSWQSVTMKTFDKKSISSRYEHSVVIQWCTVGNSTVTASVTSEGKETKFTLMRN